MIAMIPPNRPKLIRSAAAVCLAFFLMAGSCVSETVRVGPDMSPRAVTTLKRWDARALGRRVGNVTLMRIEDRDIPQTLYKVEHGGGQHAGWIDMRGRAWREEPFQQGLVLVTMDTLVEGVRQLLELPRSPELRPVERTELAAR